MDCRWGEWTIGRCSKTCGEGGRRTIRRQVVVEAAFGGKECRGPAILEESCNEWKKCPGMILHLKSFILRNLQLFPRVKMLKIIQFYLSF